MNQEFLALDELPRHRTNGPLTRRKDVPYYFVDRDGAPVYFTGSHNWSCFQECFSGNPDDTFDFDTYLDWMVSHNHSFMRGWHWEQTTFDQFTTEHCPIRPTPFLRTGPGTALDGQPKFDCSHMNPAYLERLHSRVKAAGERGIYVSVMLFEGWSTDIRRPNLEVSNPWDGHPYNRSNNINGIDGDPDQIGGGRSIHTLRDSAITRNQEAYVCSVADCLSDLDNVLYEIGNEHYEESFPWQEHMVRFIHEYERSKKYRHPVGITSGGGGDDAVTNEQLVSSSADFIAPRERGEVNSEYKSDPPVPDGSKIIISDTDHLWGIGGNVAWVWKSFTRGLNPIFMDPYEGIHGLDESEWTTWGPLNRRDHPLLEPIRCSMGYSKWFSEKLNLEKARARPELVSTGYCLDDGESMVVYLADESKATIHPASRTGSHSLLWFNPENGALRRSDAYLSSEGGMEIESPFGQGSVALISRRKTGG
jgi:hypothetical protein